MVSAWQVPQVASWPPLRMRPDSLAACGLWQVRQACPSTTATCTRSFASISVIFWAWHPRHRSAPAILGWNFFGDPGGSWHWLHICFATGAWTLL